MFLVVTKPAPVMSHPYRRTFVTKTACTDEESTFLPYMLVYLGSISPLSVAQSNRDDRRVMELQGKAVVTVSYERPWELFPASPFAHSWVCGWQWPGHVLMPKGPERQLPAGPTHAPCPHTLPIPPRHSVPPSVSLWPDMPFHSANTL